jgi:hypothetical protein
MWLAYAVMTTTTALPSQSICIASKKKAVQLTVDRGRPMRFTRLLAVALLLGGTDRAAAQAIAEVYPTEEISRGTYKTWSLFLVCNPGWVAPEKSADLARLYWQFNGFGEAIGNDNLAVWFWKRQAPTTDPKLAENVDVARSAEFCRALNLRPSKGPYLVVTNTYPDVKAFPADRAIFELGGLKPAELTNALAGLTDELLLQGKVDVAMSTARGPTAPAVEPSLWIRLLEGTRQSLIGFGCTVKLQISTGIFTAELRGCAEQ